MAKSLGNKIACRAYRHLRSCCHNPLSLFQRTSKEKANNHALEKNRCVFISKRSRRSCFLLRDGHNTILPRAHLRNYTVHTCYYSCFLEISTPRTLCERGYWRCYFRDCHKLYCRNKLDRTKRHLAKEAYRDKQAGESLLLVNHK